VHNFNDLRQLLSRRHFFGRSTFGIGGAALASLLDAGSAQAAGRKLPAGVALPQLHLPARAKRVIYLFPAGGPSQMDLYDYKPGLADWHGKELPPSTREKQRLTGFTVGQGKFPVVASPFKFQQHGSSGTWLSELLPHLGSVADELCLVKSMYTEAINHDPGVTMMMTGTQQPGRPSLGAWLSYGIGSENEDLPAFVVLLTPGSIQDASTPLSSRHWGSGFLPSRHQGIHFRSGEDPVLFLSNPPGIDRKGRRSMLNTRNALDQLNREAFGDPSISDRIAQYEMAFRMQTSVPELMDVAGEPEHVFKMYGPQSRIPRTFAANCLLARRLVEKGVRFVQVFDRDWDHHRNAPQHLRTKSQMFDQPAAALIRDLKQRGLLEDTLVVCGGEFGRSVYCQGPLQENFGRDHHGGCFTMWMAGGGIRPGMTHGKTDDFSFNIAESPVHVHDLQATILHQLGIDHKRLTFKFQSREFRLTDIGGTVVRELLS